MLYHFPYSGPLLFRDFAIMIAFRPGSAFLDLTAYLFAESSALGGWCFCLRAWRGLFNLLSIKRFYDEIHPEWLMTALFFPFGPFAGKKGPFVVEVGCGLVAGLSKFERLP